MKMGVSRAKHTKISEVTTTTQLDSIKRTSTKSSIRTCIWRLIIQEKLTHERPG